MMVRFVKAVLIIAIVLGFTEWWLARQGYELATHFDIPSLTVKDLWINQGRPLVLPPRKYKVLVVGCSFSAASNTSPDNGYVWNLNEMIPSCSFDNGAVVGAGPARCLQSMALGLKQHKYDTVIYACIGEHCMSDLTRELEVIPSPDGKGSLLTKTAGYEIVRDEKGEENVVFLPREGIIWFGDNYLRSINFAKCLMCDAWYSWNNRYIHRLQRGEAEFADYDAQSQSLTNRFAVIVRQMQRIASESGAKFGVVQLNRVVQLNNMCCFDNIREFFATNKEDMPPYLDATFPLDMMPYVLNASPGPYNGDHPNADVYRYYSQRIAHWLVAEGLLPKDTVIEDNAWSQESDLDLFAPEPQPIADYLMTAMPYPFESRQLFDKRKTLTEALDVVWHDLEAISQSQTDNPGISHLQSIEYQLKVMQYAYLLSFSENCPRAILRQYMTERVLPLQPYIASANWPRMEKAWRSYAPLAPYELEDGSEDINYWAQYLGYCSNLLGTYFTDRYKSPLLYRLNRELLFCSESIVHRRLRQPIEESCARLEELVREGRQTWCDAGFLLDDIERARKNVLKLLPTLPNGGLPKYDRDRLVDISVAEDNPNAFVSPPPEVGQQVESPLGVCFTIERMGKGRSAHVGDVCGVRFRGYLADGTALEDNYDSPVPMRFPLGGGYLVPGFERGVTGMRLGEKRHIFIPYYMAYKEAGWRNIPGRADLIYDVELVSLERYER